MNNIEYKLNFTLSNIKKFCDKYKFRESKYDIKFPMLVRKGIKIYCPLYHELDDGKIIWNTYVKVSNKKYIEDLLHQGILMEVNND